MIKDKNHVMETFSLPVLWRICQGDNNVLVNEDEESKEEAEAHGADNVHGC